MRTAHVWAAKAPAEVGHSTLEFRRLLWMEKQAVRKLERLKEKNVYNGYHM